MANDARYFPHDANARRDPRLVLLRLKMGWEGVGLYWATIEKLRESSDFCLPNDIYIMQDELRVSEEKIKEFLLFCFEQKLLVLDNKNQTFSCPSLERRMLALEELRMKRINAGITGAHARWSTQKQGNKKKQSDEENPKPAYLKHKFFEDTVFKKTFESYIEMRNRIRKTATERAKELTLKDLEKYDVKIACKMLEQSIKNSWTGVFPLKFGEEQTAQRREPKPKEGCSACHGTGKLKDFKAGSTPAQCFCVD